MYPILGRYGPFFLYSFTASWLVGLLVGLLVAYRLSPMPKRMRQWLDPVLIAGIFAITLGRLQFVWLNVDYFQANSSEWWQIQRGGLGYHGVIAGIFLTISMLSYRKNFNFATFAPLVPIFHITGWWACYLEGCGYGIPTSPSWLAGELPDTFGVIDLRYHTQLTLLTAHCLLLGWVVWARHEKVVGGLQWWCVWLVVAVVNAGISPLRADLVHPIYNIQINILIAIISVVFLNKNLKSKIQNA